MGNVRDEVIQEGYYDYYCNDWDNPYDDFDARHEWWEIGWAEAYNVDHRIWMDQV